ncbi:MAG: RNA-binding S4 domain-containing protein [Acidiferrobacterales bacterium]|nr:RNA-binding S4 domain-containing protein [Acidiferrobacterales bacterium]
MKSSVHSPSNAESQRLDTWLWASRFYKSRKLATEAIKGGHVAVNQQKAKPSKLVKLNDAVKIRRFPQTFVVIVTGLSEKRLGAPLARELYCETEQSREEREAKNQLMKNQRAGIQYDRQKPDKRNRQRMLEIKNQLPD